VLIVIDLNRVFLFVKNYAIIRPMVKLAGCVCTGRQR